MFGFDWPELIIIGIVALIFIGPEDLPDMFRQLGRFTAKLRQMSREFSRAMEQAAKDTGVSDVARDLKSTTSAKSLGLDKVREAADKFEKWDPIKNAAKPSVTMPARTLVPPPMPMTPPTKVADIAEASAADAAVAETSVPETSVPETSVADEIDDDLAHHDEDLAAPAPQPTIHGPATQALYDKQNLRAQVLAEQTEKLKAIEAGTYTPNAAPEVTAELAADTAKPAARKRTVKPKAEAVEPADAADADAPAKAPRKKKADNA